MARVTFIAGGSDIGGWNPEESHGSVDWQSRGAHTGLASASLIESRYKAESKTVQPVVCGAHLFCQSIEIRISATCQLFYQNYEQKRTLLYMYQQQCYAPNSQGHNNKLDQSLHGTVTLLMNRSFNYTANFSSMTAIIKLF